MKMEGMKGIKIRFILAAVFFGVSGISVLLTPFSITEDGGLGPAGYASGIMFWAGLILGGTMYLLLSREYKKTGTEVEMPKNKILCYICSNPLAIAADFICAVSLIGTIYGAVNIRFNQKTALVFLFLLVTGIYAHFLFNGKVFRYLYSNNQGRRKEGKAL